MSDTVPEVPGYGDLREIGSGGYSRVYRARQFEFERPVAIKVLNNRLKDSAAVAAFERECRTMGALWDHPNIVTVFASAFTSDERPCIVMKLFHEGSYSQVLRRAGPVVLDELLLLSVKVAGALATAHREGVVHGDVKPQNIFKSKFGEPALGDFGISTFVGRQDDHAPRGFSVHYAAPELIEGTPGPAADQYSLAATIYTLALGERPFESADSPTSNTNARVLLRVLDDPTPRLPDRFPTVFADAVIRAMQRDPAQRYPDLAAFGVALADVERQLGLRQTGIPLEPLQRSQPHPEPSPRDAERVAPETGESPRSQPLRESLPEPRQSRSGPTSTLDRGTKARDSRDPAIPAPKRPSVLRHRRKPPDSLAPANRTATADGTHENEPDDAAHPSEPSAATDESTTAGEPGGTAEGPGQAGTNRTRRVPPTDRAGAPTPQKTAVGSRTVEARVCRGCGLSQPPSASVCGCCGVALGKGAGAVRRVPQPQLGVIRLSGGRVEALDADLVIGRNPAREELGPHQRAVVHGEGDRTVSRRHIELRLDGWEVTASSLGSRTSLRSHNGEVSELAADVPVRLQPGDTLHYGTSAWLYYASRTVSTSGLAGTDDALPGDGSSSAASDQRPESRPSTTRTTSAKTSLRTSEAAADGRTVEARVCRGCGLSQPPSASVCGGCGVALSEDAGAVRHVPQPQLGVIRLSGGRVEALDADLVIGRNPAREELGPHQRAVVHAEGDRTVSRRHIQLRLDGWQVTASTLGRHTSLRSHNGEVSELAADVPVGLEPGDTLHYGTSAWLRYENDDQR